MRRQSRVVGCVAAPNQHAVESHTTKPQVCRNESPNQSICPRCRVTSRQTLKHAATCRPREVRSRKLPGDLTPAPCWHRCTGRRDPAVMHVLIGMHGTKEHSDTGQRPRHTRKNILSMGQRPRHTRTSKARLCRHCCFQWHAPLWPQCTHSLHGLSFIGLQMSGGLLMVGFGASVETTSRRL